MKLTIIHNVTTIINKRIVRRFTRDVRKMILHSELCDRCMPKILDRVSGKAGFQQIVDNVKVMIIF